MNGDIMAFLLFSFIVLNVFWVFKLMFSIASMFENTGMTTEGWQKEMQTIKRINDFLEATRR